jgi:hypothetical protein
MGVRLQLSTEMNIPSEDCDLMGCYTRILAERYTSEHHHPGTKMWIPEMMTEAQQFPALIYHEEQK